MRIEEERPQVSPEERRATCSIVSDLRKFWKTNESVREAHSHFRNGMSELLKCAQSLIEMPASRMREDRKAEKGIYRKIKVE